MSYLIGWLRLAGLFFYELALSVKVVVVAVLTPGLPMRSAIIALPLDVKSDAGIALLANMITLTPGTTSLHVSDDRKTLYCHVMDASDGTVTGIKDGFERAVMEVFE